MNTNARTGQTTQANLSDISDTSRPQTQRKKITFFNVHVFYETVEEFLKQTYNRGLFRTTPGSTFFLFDKYQKWFPTEIPQMKKMGTSLFLDLKKQNKIFESVGVRFFFTVKPNQLQMLEMQVKDSTKERSTKPTHQTNRIGPNRSNDVVDSDGSDGLADRANNSATSSDELLTAEDAKKLLASDWNISYKDLKSRMSTSEYEELLWFIHMG